MVKACSNRDGRYLWPCLQSTASSNIACNLFILLLVKMTCHSFMNSCHKHDMVGGGGARGGGDLCQEISFSFFAHTEERVSISGRSLIFLNVLFIFERDRARAGERHRKRETQNL